MAHRRKRSKSPGVPLIAGVVLFAIALIITVAPSMGLGIPTWDDIFAAASLQPDAATPSNEGLQAHFIDVGQGDAILLMCDGHAALIDAGTNESGAKLIGYLQKAGVTRLDYVVGTHPHEDHIGSMDDVVNTFDVGKIILPKVPDSLTPTTRTYEDLLSAIQKKGLRITQAKAGEPYELGGASLRILGPQGTIDDLNNASVVTRVVYGGTSILLMGDAEAKAEQAILDSGADVRANVLKLGHHGSSTSTSEAFLDAVGPTYGVISCGKDNSYGHPHKEILSILKKYQITAYRTDQKGSIVLASNGKGFTIRTEK